MIKQLLIFLLFIHFVSCNTSNSDVNKVPYLEGYYEKEYPDGGYQKGFWKNGELNGEGIRYYGFNSKFSGDTYIGEFKDGEFNGYGTYTDVSNNIYVEGYWINGERDKDRSTLFWIDLDLPILSKDFEWDYIRDEKNNFETVFYHVDTFEVNNFSELVGGHSLNRTHYDYNVSASDHINLAYSVKVLDVTPSIEELGEEEYIVNNHQTILYQSNSTLVSSEWITFRGVNALKVKDYNEEKNAFMYGYLFLKDGRDYRLTVITRAADEDNGFIMIFLRSFSFLDDNIDLKEALERD